MNHLMVVKPVYRYERGTDPLKRELYKSPDTSKKYQEDIESKRSWRIC